MKRVLTIALVLVLAALSASATDLKVAVLAPLSGAVPSFGLSDKQGALLAINEWNAKGGVLGMKIVPIVEDSQCDAAAATNAANKVINQDGVHYIIGEVCSSATIPVSEIAGPAKVIEISGQSTNPNVTVDKAGKTKPYIFRACYIDPFQGGILAQFSKTRLKANKAFIMYDQGNDYTIGLATAFESKFKAMGGTIVGKETYTKTDTDFSAILAKIKNADPQVVLSPTTTTSSTSSPSKPRKKASPSPSWAATDGTRPTSTSRPPTAATTPITTPRTIPAPRSRTS